MLSKVYDKKASSSPVMFAHTDCHPLLSAVLLHRLANDFKFAYFKLCCFPVGAGYFRQSKLQDMLSTRQWSHDHCLVIKVWSY